MFQGLNAAILKQVKTLKYSVADTAPSTFEDLIKAPSLIVWSGASDRTIYGDPAVNWAFRAWHDSLHLKLNAPFTLEGEKRVALEQARLVDSDAIARIILAEVVGQAEYFAKQGEFPVDQVAFIKAALAA